MSYSNAYEILKILANECRKQNGMAISREFSRDEKQNFEKNQEYKSYLEELASSRYIKISKESCSTGELWIIEVKPKGYLKAFELASKNIY